VPLIHLSKSRDAKKRHPIEIKEEDKPNNMMSPRTQDFKFEEIPALSPGSKERRERPIKHIQGKNFSTKLRSPRDDRTFKNVRKTIFTPPKVMNTTKNSDRMKFQFLGVPMHHKIGHILQSHRAKLIK